MLNYLFNCKTIPPTKMLSNIKYLNKHPNIDKNKLFIYEFEFLFFI